MYALPKCSNNLCNNSATKRPIIELRMVFERRTNGVEENGLNSSPTQRKNEFGGIASFSLFHFVKLVR